MALEDNTTGLRDILEQARSLPSAGSYDDTELRERIATIEGKEAGWNAKGTYSKPSGGIPKTDLASAVQTSLGKADTALQEHQDISGKQDVINDLETIRSGASKGATALQSYTETDPIFNASPAKNITSANITSWNGKADKPTVATSLPSTLVANTFYNLGTLTGSKTIALPSSRTAVDEFMLQFTTGSTAPTITWPSGVTWLGGAPTINASKTYQVSIMNNLGVIAEF